MFFILYTAKLSDKSNLAKQISIDNEISIDISIDNVVISIDN